MNEQADDQNETSAVALADSNPSPTTDSSASMDTAAEPAGTASSAPPEDSGDQGTKEAEASGSTAKNIHKEPWRQHLNRFHHDINGILATKENFKLVCVDKQAKDAFSRNWKLESNRYFQLVVNLRRRGMGTKVGGKSVS